jgi:glycosyltransferase involved in cell wall biosynthesis
MEDDIGVTGKATDGRGRESISMKIVHVSPTFFCGNSIVGGGERYPLQLAMEMSKWVDTSLISFSTQASSNLLGRLNVRIYPSRLLQNCLANPLSFKFVGALVTADVIHVHQVSTMVSDFSAITGWLLRKPVFVTSHGGGGGVVLHRHLPVLRCYENAIAQSEHAASVALPEVFRNRTRLIRGGIDTQQFYPCSSVAKERTILCVARIVPHKGINYLLEAFRSLDRPDYSLTILGRSYDDVFLQHLRELAHGLNVRFLHDADDTRLLHEYRSASVVVLPSVARDMNGNHSEIAELMGMAALEAQACGTPVVVTTVAALPEFVEHGRTGLVVAQNSPEALADGIRTLLSLGPDEYDQYRTRCREWAVQFDWRRVVDAHLKVYTAALTKSREAHRRKAANDGVAYV